MQATLRAPARSYMKHININPGNPKCCSKKKS